MPKSPLHLPLHQFSWDQMFHGLDGWQRLGVFLPLLVIDEQVFFDCIGRLEKVLWTKSCQFAWDQWFHWMDGETRLPSGHWPPIGALGVGVQLGCVHNYYLSGLLASLQIADRTYF